MQQNIATIVLENKNVQEKKQSKLAENKSLNDFFRQVTKQKRTQMFLFASFLQQNSHKLNTVIQYKKLVFLKDENEG